MSTFGLLLTSFNGLTWGLAPPAPCANFRWACTRVLLGSSGPASCGNPEFRFLFPFPDSSPTPPPPMAGWQWFTPPPASYSEGSSVPGWSARGGELVCRTDATPPLFPQDKPASAHSAHCRTGLPRFARSKARDPTPHHTGAPPWRRTLEPHSGATHWSPIIECQSTVESTVEPPV